MKKITFTLTAFVLLITQNLSSQNGNSKNVVKFNLFGLPSALPLQYERALTKKISVAGTITYIPGRKLPAAIDAKELVDTKFKGIAITPELRFYPGSKGAPRGFYLAPYLRYANYSLSTPYDFVDTLNNTTTLDLKAAYKAFGGGLMIGVQWLIKNRVSIDWWILGFHGGGAAPSVTLSGDEFRNLSSAQKDELEADLEALEAPFGNFNADVTNTSAKLSIKMPYIGARAGLCIGIAF